MGGFFYFCLVFTRLCLVWILLGLSVEIQAQTNIGGTINSYDTLVSPPISNICGDTVSVAQLSTYASGDLLCFYLPVDASFDTSFSASFGDSLSLNNAGRLAVAYVNAVLGSSLILDRKLPYAFPAGTMVIKVPEYGYANVSNTISAPVFQNGMGGVVAMKARRLRLSADIDLSEKGFAGGFSSRYMGVGCGTMGYRYPANNNGGAPKGAGIAFVPSNMANGRGKALNGGGGGNNHNAGGGGGSNFGKGGKGGNEWSGCSPIAANGGIGGQALGALNDRYFLGGGGGSGHNNVVGLSSEGGRGGGLLIIFCDSLENNGGRLITNGGDGKTMTGSGAEGAGGGGAAGTMLLAFQKIIGAINVEALGGDGGGVPGGSAGPGGGGSGGLILAPDPNVANYTNGSLQTSLSGGPGGTVSSGSAYGSTSGDPGAILQNLGIMYPQTQFGLLMAPGHLGRDTSICPGDSIILRAPGNLYAWWSDGTNADSLIVKSPGVYWLEVGVATCRARDSIEISFKSVPALDLGPDQSICRNDSVLLQSPYGNGNLWSTGDTSLSIYANSPGWYWLDFDNDTTCSVRDSIFIALDSSAQARVIDTSICQGDSFQVSYPSSASLTWDDGSSSISRYFSSAGIYWVKVQIPGSCERVDSLYLTVDPNVSDTSLISFEDTTICRTQNLELDLSFWKGNIRWFDNGTQKIRSFAQSGLYDISFEENCISGQDTFRLRVVDCDTCELYLPNAFSPNSDQLNNYFGPVSPCEPVSYKLILLDRWGEKVFESDRIDFKWDGHFKGLPAMQGIYVYDLIYRLPNQQEVRRQGFFHLRH